MNAVVDRVIPWRSSNGSVEQIDSDELFDALRNSRRRAIVRTLVEDYDGETTISNLSEYIAAIECNVDHPHELTSRERKTVYVGLYQSHIPKLDGYGIVGEDRGEVWATPLTEVAYNALKNVEGTPGVRP